MSENVNLSALDLLKATANLLGLGPRKRLTKGALVALETVQPVAVSKYGVQMMFSLDSERVIEDWNRKGACDDGIPFPEPVEITGRLHRWDCDELRAWWQQKKAKRAQGGPF